MNKLHMQTLALSTLVLLSAQEIAHCQAGKPTYTESQQPSDSLSDLVPVFKTIPKDVLNIIARYLNAADISSRLWATGFQEKAVLESHLNDHTVYACFSPDGNTIISPNNYQVQAWDAHSGKRLPPIISLTHRNPVYIKSVYYNHTGEKIIITCNNVAIVYNIQTKKDFILRGHTAEVWNAQFNPIDDTQIVTASADTTARIWNDTAYQPMTHTLEHKGYIVFNASFSPDGTQVITLCHDHKARVWDAATGSLQLTLLKNHLINKATFHTDGKKIIVSNWNKELCICDAADGTILKTLRGHTDSISSIVCSTDGNTIISSSEDNTIRVWDSKTGTCLHDATWQYANARNELACRVSSISLSQDNNKLVTAGSVIGARVWAPAFSTLSITMEQVILIKLLDKHRQKEPHQLETIAEQESVDCKKLYAALYSFKDSKTIATLAQIYGIKMKPPTPLSQALAGTNSPKPSLK